LRRRCEEFLISIFRSVRYRYLQPGSASGSGGARSSVLASTSWHSVIISSTILVAGLMVGASPQAAPINDNFACATVVSGSSVSVTGSNVGATKEAGEPNIVSYSAGGRSVWWTWTAPASGSVRISTASSSFDTLLGVYIGSSVSALTLMA